MAKPKILFFDIETSPNLAYVWGMWEQNVIKFETEWQLLSVAWRWQGQAGVHCLTTERDTERAVATVLHDLLSEADLVIAHNGDAFDLPKVRARMIALGLPPLPPVASVDTLKVAKKYFKFNSNKLSDLCEHLGLGKKKDDGGFKTWLGCLKGDAKCWKKMSEYNRHDVVLLERLYDKLSPWMDNHPNLAQLTAFPTGCPKCQSDNLIRSGYRVTRVHKRQRWFCRDCGAYHLRTIKQVNKKQISKGG